LLVALFKQKKKKNKQQGRKRTCICFFQPMREYIKI
jgi:hypothetical protein